MTDKPQATDPTDSAKHSADELFDFPCDFPIKVMGKTHPEFHDTIVDVLKAFDKDFDRRVWSRARLRAATTPVSPAPCARRIARISTISIARSPAIRWSR